MLLSSDPLRGHKKLGPYNRTNYQHVNSDIQPSAPLAAWYRPSSQNDNLSSPAWIRDFYLWFRTRRSDDGMSCSDVPSPRSHATQESTNNLAGANMVSLTTYSVSCYSVGFNEIAILPQCCQVQHPNCRRCLPSSHQQYGW